LLLSSSTDLGYLAVHSFMLMDDMASVGAAPASVAEGTASVALMPASVAAPVNPDYL
jgi:hypothetical protein